jgi:predicted enzyme related to lactoylglutathione lyase
MDFVSTRVITGDIKRLVRFYEEVTGVKSLPSAGLAQKACSLG